MNRRRLGVVFSLCFLAAQSAAAAEPQLGDYVRTDGTTLKITSVQPRSIDFILIFRVPDGDAQRRCAIDGTANVAGGVAVFDERLSRCRLSMQFHPRSVDLTHTGPCKCKGNVALSGSYAHTR
ncbi:MAG: hypothetical protein FJX46_02140 [Alphaproteobacteria bacterium]|nr:hypothetical protein [Alphaproteobacteria bacterium]